MEKDLKNLKKDDGYKNAQEFLKDFDAHFK